MGGKSSLEDILLGGIRRYIFPGMQRFISLCVGLFDTRQSTNRLAMANFWRTFHHGGKFIPAWHAFPLSLYQIYFSTKRLFFTFRESLFMCVGLFVIYVQHIFHYIERFTLPPLTPPKKSAFFVYRVTFYFLLCMYVLFPPQRICFSCIRVICYMIFRHRLLIYTVNHTYSRCF
jgi:hypothetical protein